MINRSVTELQSDLLSTELQINALSTRLGKTYSTVIDRETLQRHHGKLTGMIKYRTDGLSLVPKRDDEPVDLERCKKATFKAADLKPHSTKSDIWGDGK